MRNYPDSKYKIFHITTVTVCSGWKSDDDLWRETKRCLFDVLLPIEKTTGGLAQCRKKPNIGIPPIPVSISLYTVISTAHSIFTFQLRTVVINNDKRHTRSENQSNEIFWSALFQFHHFICLKFAAAQSATRYKTFLFGQAFSQT